MNLVYLKSKVEVEYSAKLVAVSKTKPVEDILKLYNQGQKMFGENRVQELVEKYDQLPKDIHWHIIGTLQKNKVKYIAPFVELIHSVDGLDLLKTINKEAIKNNRVIEVLLQIRIAQEETKQGFEWEQLLNDITSDTLDSLQSVRVVGVMGMASFVDDNDQVKEEFAQLKRYFEILKKDIFTDDSFKEISMGMSGDYEIALDQGATLVRIGSALFGSRN
jgi:hypothetical protein